MSLLKKVYKKVLNKHYAKKGFSSYYVDFWRKEIKNSYKNSDLPKSQIKWAKKRGFKPFRIKQYGLTEENYKDIISDVDYFWIYPLNDRKASSWIDDKLTMKYVLSAFDEFLPRYYYHILNSRGVLRLRDCPDNYEFSAKGVVNLLKDKKVLAAKMVAGTYGIGFYKLEYANGKFIANGKEYDETEFENFIASLNNYIITEFVEMHPQLKKLNPHSVNTIRVMVINEHGDDPIIPFAFMRIGTKKSGIVDNTAQGGMFCKVNVETGRYYDGETAVNHEIKPVKYHPDTNEEIEGILPNWELVKEKLIEMAHYYPQLKYLGYDIAITQQGFEIIEINSHQGLHKAHMFPKEVKEFFNREIERKNLKYKR